MLWWQPGASSKRESGWFQSEWQAVRLLPAAKTVDIPKMAHEKLLHWYTGYTSCLLNGTWPPLQADTTPRVFAPTLSEHHVNMCVVVIFISNTSSTRMTGSSGLLRFRTIKGDLCQGLEQSWYSHDVSVSISPLSSQNVQTFDMTPIFTAVTFAVGRKNRPYSLFSFTSSNGVNRL